MLSINIKKHANGMLFYVKSLPISTDFNLEKAYRGMFCTNPINDVIIQGEFKIM